MTALNRLSRHPLLLPAVALAGWGCALPGVAMLDRLALSFVPRVIAGIYATHFLALLLIATVATGLASLLWLAIRANADARAPQWRVWAELVSATLFGLIFFYAGRTIVFSWAARHDVVVPLLPWLAVTVPLSLLLAHYARRLLDNLIGFSWFLVLVGLTSVPFAFFDIDKTPAPAAIPTPLTRPDILLVTIDTLSARQMSLHGADQPTTPNIDRLAASALVFDRAYAGGNFTTSGINTLLTGRYPDEHRAVQLGGRALPSLRATSLPALFSRVGYRNTYVSTNSKAAPWHNGYARYFEDGVGDATNWRLYFCKDEWIRWLPYNCELSHPVINLATGLLYSNGAQNLQFDGRLVESATRQLVERAQGDPRPLFLWTHLTPPHDPYASPGSCLGRFYSGPEHRTAADSVPIYGLRPKTVPLRNTQLLEQRYRESLWCVDRTVAQIVNTFRTRARPFVLIISADHGESFTPSLTGHGGPWLNEDVIRIPLIIALPGMTAGQRTSVVASQTDVLPIAKAILHGADVSAILRLVEARRRYQPALAMEFIDNSRLAPLRRGGIAALGTSGKYIRYLSPPGPFTDLREQFLDGAGPATVEGRWLRSAVTARLARTGGRITR